MAVDMFLKLDGIDGESADSKHGKEIDILAWSWGASQSGTYATGGGGGAGKVNVQDISFTKWIDAASTHLFFRCCNGDPIKTATLVCRKAGKDQQEYLKITLNDCIVSSYSPGGSGGEDRMTENFSLNFSKVKYEYWPQKEDGSLGSVIPNGWDIKGNTKN